MALLQLARGLWTKFAKTENPFEAINGMEENLRLIDDHLGLYTVLPPQAPGTAFPDNPANGDGQIYTDGTYAVYNAEKWKQYNPRRGVNALEPDGTRWWNTGGGWVYFQGVAREELSGADGAAIVGAFDKTKKARWGSAQEAIDYLSESADLLRSSLAGPSSNQSVLSNTFAFRKVSSTRFEIFKPTATAGVFERWRFDNDAAQFVDASPSDASLGFVRPFLQTTVQLSSLSNTKEILASEITSTSTKVTSGNYQYINTTGAYFEIEAEFSSVRVTYLSASNAGIMRVTINGSSYLVNGVPKSGGNADIDCYSAASSSSQSVMLASGLPHGRYLVRIECIGKNPESTDNRIYLSNLAGFGALRVYRAYDGTGLPQEIGGETLKIGGSAVDYAIAFKPAGSGAASPFIGSVHGYENRESLKIFMGGSEIDFQAAEINKIYSCWSGITVLQGTKITHPSNTAVQYAACSSVWQFSSAQVDSRYKLTWLQDVEVTNGYSEMFTVWGGNSGGANGPKVGWCDRALVDGKVFDLSAGALGEFGRVLASDVLFFGTSRKPAETQRNAGAGFTGCRVRLNTLQRSFYDLKGGQAAADGVFIQDRPTFKKLYAQPYRGIGLIKAGQVFRGDKTVFFFNAVGDATDWVA